MTKMNNLQSPVAVICASSCSDMFSLASVSTGCIVQLCFGHIALSVISPASVDESPGSATDLMPARLTVLFSCCVLFISVWNAVE